MRLFFWTFSGEHLDEDSAGKRRYEDADDRADCRRGYKHRTRSTSDLWYVWIAEDGNRRSCGSNRRWSDRSGADRHAQRIPEVAGVICISAGYPQDL